jgi:release factor glutamine methyltransferase
VPDFTIKSAHSFLYNSLLDIGIEESEARAEADLVLKTTTGLGAHQLILQADNYPGAEFDQRLRDIVEQRRRRVPLQYILGEASFQGLQFEVGPAVLIPRGDTESLVAAAADYAAGYIDAELRLLEVGAGSGAISISLLRQFPLLTVTAFEISPEAAALCLRNAERHGVSSRLDLRVDDYASSLSKLSGTYDVFVSNPPYIPAGDLPDLAPEVREFEPMLALRGEGLDGLGFYRSFAAMLPANTALNRAAVFLECGDGQGPKVEQLFEAVGYETRLICDLSGKARVMAALPPEKTL